MKNDYYNQTNKYKQEKQKKDPPGQTNKHIQQIKKIHLGRIDEGLTGQPVCEDEDDQ